MTYIYVTQKCHKHCVHCYYPNGDSIMTKETSEYLSDWLTNIYKDEKVKFHKIHFLGGEPLTNLDCVLSIVDNVEAKKPSYTEGHPDGAYLVFTNGDFITNDILTSFKQRGIKVLLNPTYDSISDIEDKIRLIKSIMHGCSLALILDEYNIQRSEKLARMAINNSCHMRINRLYHGGTIPGYVDMYKFKMNKILDMMLQFEKPIWPNWIVESTYPTWTGVKNPYSCGKWLLVIDPDGTVRSCNADLNTEIGTIFNTNKFSDFKFIQRWSAKNLIECEGCEWINLCQGGCPYTRKLTYGTYEKKSPFCSAFKELFPKIKKLTGKWNLR